MFNNLWSINIFTYSIEVFVWTLVAGHNSAKISDNRNKSTNGLF